MSLSSGAQEASMGVPSFLFAERMRWYKWTRISLGALKRLDDEKVDFRMVFIGGGIDKANIVDYSR